MVALFIILIFVLPFVACNGKVSASEKTGFFAIVGLIGAGCILWNILMG